MESIIVICNVLSKINQFLILEFRKWEKEIYKRRPGRRYNLSLASGHIYRIGIGLPNRQIDLEAFIG